MHTIVSRLMREGERVCGGAPHEVHFGEPSVKTFRRTLTDAGRVKKFHRSSRAHPSRGVDPQMKNLFSGRPLGAISAFSGVNVEEGVGFVKQAAPS